MDATYEAITRHILEQPDGLAHVLLDEKIEDVPNYQVAVRSNQPPIIAPSLPALADALGLPADALVAAVAEYNAACPSGGSFEPLALDARSTSGLNPPKSNWARPLDTPPFRAYPITCANVFSFGGLLVNSSAQVIDREGLPIGGLYAAGEVIGLYHGSYIGSTSVLRGAVFGRQAGRHAPRLAAAAKG